MQFSITSWYKIYVNFKFFSCVMRCFFRLKWRIVIIIKLVVLQIICLKFSCVKSADILCGHLLDSFLLRRKFMSTFMTAITHYTLKIKFFKRLIHLSFSLVDVLSHFLALLYQLLWTEFVKLRRFTKDSFILIFVCI